MQSLKCHWRGRKTYGAQVELLVETCWSKEGHYCIQGCGSERFLLFENQSTCCQQKALCALMQRFNLTTCY
jgi:hypothetical protein